MLVRVVFEKEAGQLANQVETIDCLEVWPGKNNLSFLFHERFGTRGIGWSKIYSWSVLETDNDSNQQKVDHE